MTYRASSKLWAGGLRIPFTGTGALDGIAFGTSQPPLANTNEVSKVTRSDFGVSLSG